MAITNSHYLTYDEFVDLRNIQDEALSKEFSLVRNNTEHLRTELRDTSANIRAELRSSVNELRTEIRNVRTAQRNGSLKNPILPFRAPLVYDYTNQRIVEPDRKLFPRHAREFYALRDPDTERQRKILIYLAGFYDVQIEVEHDVSEGDSSEDEAVLADPIRIVELLGGIFGLNEDNFIRFTERAQELDARPSSPKKRLGAQEAAATNPTSVRRKLNICTRGPSPEDKSISSKGEKSARLEWGPRTTPSSQRPTINRVKGSQPEPADSGSPTNPFTSPRDPGK